MRWTPDSQKRVQPLANSTGMSGISKVSLRQPKSRYTELSFLPPSFIGCEMWTIYHQWHMKKLNHFHMTCLRKILSITWQKHPNTKVFFNSGGRGLLYTVSTPSWCIHSFIRQDMLSAWKITAFWRNCSTANCLRASTPMEARKSTSKIRWRSPWNLLVSPLIV